jgi:hypothetical protein
VRVYYRTLCNAQVREVISMEYVVSNEMDASEIGTGFINRKRHARWLDQDLQTHNSVPWRMIKRKSIFRPSYLDFTIGHSFSKSDNSLFEIHVLTGMTQHIDDPSWDESLVLQLPASKTSVI